MVAKARGAAFWEPVIAAAKLGVSHDEVAARFGVTKAALKYHLYKKKGATAKVNKEPRVLPVRVASEKRWLELEFSSGVRLRFLEGCDVAYVASIATRLR